MEEDTMRFSSLIGVTGAALALGVVLSGCPDPEGQFDEFEKRQAALGDGGSGTGGAPECLPTIEGEADGEYLFALSATLDPPKAFALAGTLVTHAGDPLTVDLSLQPLAKEDQMTAVGDPLVYTDLPVNADGSFEWDLGDIVLVNAANPISEFDVAATVQLNGGLCGGDDLGFICGNVTGVVTAPLNMFDLAGSTFTMQRYEGDIPAPVINCAK
ncbi:MAG: hypothetical protein JNK04_25535, partial [Myxococcales bacterium]|nr:hypothetical protein [Myxococcales bacterium]